MRADKPKEEPQTSGHMEERFNRFAKALMAVPKKELDKEMAKHDRKKQQSQKKDVVRTPVKGKHFDSHSDD
jgi:hypothetical protein